MANLNLIPDQMKQANSRPMMIRSAAKALAQLPMADAVGIASSSTANFVATTRKTWKAQGFNFTDTDIREIHEVFQAMLSERINREGLGPKVS